MGFHVADLLYFCSLKYNVKNNALKHTHNEKAFVLSLLCTPSHSFALLDYPLPDFHLSPFTFHLGPGPEDQDRGAHRRRVARPAARVYEQRHFGKRQAEGEQPDHQGLQARLRGLYRPDAATADGLLCLRRENQDERQPRDEQSHQDAHHRSHHPVGRHQPHQRL